MGYCSTLFIIEKSNKESNITYTFDNGKSLYFSSLLASIELEKDYKVSEKMRYYPETDSYFYDCQTAVYEDCYGRPLTEISVEDALSILQGAQEVEYYRRRTVAIAYLKSLIENKQYWGDVAVLHYGH